MRQQTSIEQLAQLFIAGSTHAERGFPTPCERGKRSVARDASHGKRKMIQCEAGYEFRGSNLENDTNCFFL